MRVAAAEGGGRRREQLSGAPAGAAVDPAPVRRAPRFGHVRTQAKISLIDYSRCQWGTGRARGGGGGSRAAALRPATAGKGLAAPPAAVGLLAAAAGACVHA
jgi:hypothetical protein